MKIFFSVGEPSGDLHGANLIRQLRAREPSLECVGYGGPLMRDAGCRLHDDLTELAVMMLGRALWHLPRFWNLASRADWYCRERRPDAVVLIDYPGFNWWIAGRAKAHGIPVFYYGVPQLWAWASWRVRKMRRLVDHALVKLPFEEPWFNERGCRATHVGHPFFDQLEQQQLDAAFLARQRSQPGRLVTILPGSRTQEIANNFHWFVKAVRRVRQQVPDARFAVAAYKPKHCEQIQALVDQSGLPIEVHVGRTPELMAAAHCCMACSGSVSLELLYHRKPTVVLYWLPYWTYTLLSYLVKVPYITLVNLLVAEELTPKNPRPYDPDGPRANEPIFPEYPTYQDKSHRVADHVIQWLNNETQYAHVVARLERLKKEVARGGASITAAKYILGELQDAEPRRLHPHYRPAQAA